MGKHDDGKERRELAKAYDLLAESARKAAAREVQRMDEAIAARALVKVSGERTRTAKSPGK